jgi:hypothetical protein
VEGDRFRVEALVGESVVEKGKENDRSEIDRMDGRP